MWWQILIGAAVLIVVVYGFICLTGFETRMLTRRTDRTAEDMYDAYAEPVRKQRRYAGQRDGEWKGEDE
jgi:hypothetical protein